MKAKMKQPRVPAGSPRGGEFASTGAAQADLMIRNTQIKHTERTGQPLSRRLAAREVVSGKRQEAMSSESTALLRKLNPHL